MPLPSRVNCAEELMALLGAGDGPGPELTLRRAAPPSPDPDPDPPDDALSVSEDSASRYSFAPSTDARRGGQQNAVDRTAPKMAAIASFLLEAVHSGVLALVSARPSRPHGAVGGGHRYVFWLASDTLARAVGLFGSGVAAAGSATGDAEAEELALLLLVSKEYAGLWNATASVRLVVVALPPDATAVSVAAAETLGSSTGRDRSVEAGVLGAGDLEEGVR